ncbi:radical SAM protein [Patescibacteria group bacterium]|nr:radical SAM protein [Patescibacteria group bacterium]MBU1868090.1 radical SAM protein [Patescibacteria group bacterium]
MIKKKSDSFIFYNQRVRDVVGDVGGIQEVEFVFGTKCDWAQCRHCFFSDFSHMRPLEEAVSAVSKLVERGIRVIPATGEIMSHPEYLALYTVVGAKYILTNGLRLASKEGPELARMLTNAGIEQVGFTLNDKDDPLRGVSPIIVTKAVKVVRQVGLIPTATFIVTNRNYNRVEEIVQKTLEIGFRALKFNRLVPTRPEMISLTLSPKQTRIFFKQVQAQKGIIPPERLKLYASGLCGLRGRGGRVSCHPHFCLAGRGMVAISPDNRVYPCILLMFPEYQIGKFNPKTGEIGLRENGFTKGWYGQRECGAYELLYLDRTSKVPLCLD